MPITTENNTPPFVRNAVNLASAGLGARGLFCTDEFFAPLARLLDDHAPVFIQDKYDDHGKWMDGWESRRRRGSGHDYAIVQLATRGELRGFDVDTSHFTGNYPPACRIEGCLVESAPDEETQWLEVLPISPLGPSAHHYFSCNVKAVFSHVRLHIYPDGGIARLRVYGEPRIDLAKTTGLIDLASALNGGRVLAFSDAHYGAYHRLLAPGRGLGMGDGWETRRRREPGNDWLILALGARGILQKVEIDTAHYKGNYPDTCSLLGADLADFAGSDFTAALVAASVFWDTVLEPQKLSADAIHTSPIAQVAQTPVTHVRLNIFPDGGISRLRLFGELT